MRRDRYFCATFILFVLLSVILSPSSVASAASKEKILYSFQGAPEGEFPIGQLTFDEAGNLYGITTGGGNGGMACENGSCGIVYKLTPPTVQGAPSTETVLYNFRGKNYNDAEVPEGGVIFDWAGNLYGTTAYGGSGNCRLLGSLSGCGAVFRLTPGAAPGQPWTESVIYSFRGGRDGHYPFGDLVFDDKGNLYGTTAFGGGFGYQTCNKIYGYCGTVFKLSPPKTKGGAWKEQILYSFKAGSDGANPYAGVILDDSGALYGTTYLGGNPGCPQDGVGCGIVFKLEPPTKKGGAWKEIVLYRFKPRPDGGNPLAGLVLDGNGNLYGTNISGGTGTSPSGTVFRLTRGGAGKPWVETLLHTFGNVSFDGYFPMAGLTFDPTGKLWGTTNQGGEWGAGTIFHLEPLSENRRTWKYGGRYSFTGVPDGSFPRAKLALNHAGNFYGSTVTGGSGENCLLGQFGCGTVFEFTPQ